jgi:hypothetical protein
MDINSATIPAWFVALNMILAGFMLILAYNRKLRVLSTLAISGKTLLFESMIYAIVFQFFNLDTETRGFIVRLMIIIICMSFYVPLYVSYLRSRNRGT